MSNVPHTYKCLIADDDPVFVMLGQSCLHRAGHLAHTFGDGAAAFEALCAGGYDCALIDLAMPRVDGFRLIAMIRGTPALQDLPIIVLTSRNDVEAIEEAYRLGANAFETKPINWTLLPAHLDNVVRTGRLIGALKAALEKAAGKKAAALLQAT